MTSKKLKQAPPQINIPVKQATIADRFKELDYFEAIAVYGEIKAIMKERTQTKYKELDGAQAQIKEFCVSNNL